MLAAHIQQLDVAFGESCEPMDAMPFRAHDLAERIAGPETDAYPVGFGALAKGTA